jgi:hypothetical protein
MRMDLLCQPDLVRCDILSQFALAYYRIGHTLATMGAAACKKLHPDN